MKVFFIQIGNLFSACVRHLYWLYQLSKSRSGKGFRFKWPVKLEGRGILIIGNNGYIGKNAHIGCANGTKLQFGDDVTIRDNTILILKENIQFIAGNQVQINDHSRIYVQNNWKWGNGVRISTYCQIFSRENGLFGQLNIDDGSYIGDGSIVDVSGNVIIGKEVAIGPSCIIYTHDHAYNNTGAAAWKGPVHVKDVVVEDGAWIGSRVTILPGVTIGKKSVIATGAVVTKDIPAGAVWGGVPAKQLKSIEQVAPH